MATNSKLSSFYGDIKSYAYYAILFLTSKQWRIPEDLILLTIIIYVLQFKNCFNFNIIMNFIEIEKSVIHAIMAAILAAILNFSKRSRVHLVHPADSERVDSGLSKSIKK